MLSDMRRSSKWCHIIIKPRSLKSISIIKDEGRIIYAVVDKKSLMESISLTRVISLWYHCEGRRYDTRIIICGDNVGAGSQSAPAGGGVDNTIRGQVGSCPLPLSDPLWWSGGELPLSDTSYCGEVGANSINELVGHYSAPSRDTPALHSAELRQTRDVLMGWWGELTVPSHSPNGINGGEQRVVRLDKEQSPEPAQGLGGQKTAMIWTRGAWKDQVILGRLVP